ncbi:abscisic acid-deficient protein Aba4 family protein [Coraliomargarita parva]|uniref:abscisic acid-deficient protein Aba4 family protein n=1 Tax=Coraliomargarita parva TaxID=3014050 RepID=UPI0022B455F4|nr:abscisic acid-deficient protein Aba4 family protein [Coraliomargarita parva]
MPIWLIEFFGEGDLNAAFYLILFMTAPVWLAMIVVPESKTVRHLAQPLLVGSVYGLVLLYLVWQFYEARLIPQPLSTADYGGAKALANHPTVFLSLFCNLQILNLCVGTLLYQIALRNRMRVTVELVLCWLLGAVALIPLAVRMLIRKQSLN